VLILEKKHIKTHDKKEGGLVVENNFDRFIRIYQTYGTIGLLKGARSLVKQKLHKHFCEMKENQRERIYQEKLATSKIDHGEIEIEILGYKMRVLSDDRGLSRDLLIDGIREDGSTHLMESILHGDMIAFDIGANLGYYLLLEATRLGRNSHIFAFEPHPDNFRMLKKNIELNGMSDKVSIYQCAVSDRNGSAELIVEHCSNYHRLVSSATMPAKDETQRINVQTVSLDSFCKEHEIESADFIRMDVEGQEVEIIRGARDVIKRSPNCVIFLEIHPWLLRHNASDKLAPFSFLRQLESLNLKLFALPNTKGRKSLVKLLDWEYIHRNLSFLLSDYGFQMFLAKNPERLSLFN